MMLSESSSELLSETESKSRSPSKSPIRNEADKFASVPRISRLLLRKVRSSAFEATIPQRMLDAINISRFAVRDGMLGFNRIVEDSPIG